MILKHVQNMEGAPWRPVIWNEGAERRCRMGVETPFAALSLPHIIRVSQQKEIG